MPIMWLPAPSALIQDGATALMHAAKSGSVEVVDLLLRHGARIQHQDKVIRGKERESVPAWDSGLNQCAGIL